MRSAGTGTNTDTDTNTNDNTNTNFVRDFKLGTDTIGLADGLTYENLEITGDIHSYIAVEGSPIGVLFNVNSNDLSDRNFEVI